MIWILIAILAYFLFALSALLDKIFLSQHHHLREYVFLSLKTTKEVFSPHLSLTKKVAFFNCYWPIFASSLI